MQKIKTREDVYEADHEHLGKAEGLWSYYDKISFLESPLSELERLFNRPGSFCTHSGFLLKTHSFSTSLFMDQGKPSSKTKLQRTFFPSVFNAAEQSVPYSKISSVVRMTIVNTVM